MRVLLLALIAAALTGQESVPIREPLLPLVCTPQRVSPDSDVWGCREWEPSFSAPLATQKEVADLTKRVEELEKLLGSFIQGYIDGSAGRTNPPTKDIGIGGGGAGVLVVNEGITGWSPSYALDIGDQSIAQLEIRSGGGPDDQKATKIQPLKEK